MFGLTPYSFFPNNSFDLLVFLDDFSHNADGSFSRPWKAFMGDFMIVARHDDLGVESKVDEFNEKLVLGRAEIENALHKEEISEDEASLRIQALHSVLKIEAFNWAKANL
jgi:hypothetical protein